MESEFVFRLSSLTPIFYSIRRHLHGIRRKSNCLAEFRFTQTIGICRLYMVDIFNDYIFTDHFLFFYTGVGIFFLIL